MIRHAGLVATRLLGRWRGALIEGPSGTGKSDLAIRMIGAGFRLVADDRVIVWTSGGRLFGKAPAPIAGLVEARGVGVIPATALDYCEIAMVVKCQSKADAVQRMPDVKPTKIQGVSLPRIELWPFEAAGPAKLRRALEHLGTEA
jgi:serine kinase of HPr protein (carbohydrate metabolism regulator)